MRRGYFWLRSARFHCVGHFHLQSSAPNFAESRLIAQMATSSNKDGCRLKPIIAIFIGAGLGALLRWWLGLTLNSYFPSIPPGTLAANLIGGYIIGLAVAFFPSSALAPEWRLFVITGFCG